MLVKLVEVIDYKNGVPNTRERLINSQYVIDAQSEVTQQAPPTVSLKMFEGDGCSYFITVQGTLDEVENKLNGGLATFKTRLVVMQMMVALTSAKPILEQLAYPASFKKQDLDVAHVVDVYEQVRAAALEAVQLTKD